MKLSPKHLSRLLLVSGLALLSGLLLLWWLVPAVFPERPARPPLPAVVSAGAFDALQPILPLPEIPELPPLRVALGERLFHDTRFSADGTLSCASCHDLGRGGVDGRKVSIGIGGAIGAINAPTVFNSGLSFVQFWDGRAASLEEQAAGPIHNPVELGSNWAEVLGRLRQDGELVARFKEAYGAGPSEQNIVDALASFERTLITRNSRFDRYLAGDTTALTAREAEGYRLFREYGCVSCHQGVLIGGNMYQKFGVLGDYFAHRPQTKADLGRYNVTGRESDRHVFKVPSLRNVALTAPYFHDGSASTLQQAVTTMGRYQLGRELDDGDVEAITDFLGSLTGEWRGAPLQ